MVSNTAWRSRRTNSDALLLSMALLRCNQGCVCPKAGSEASLIWIHKPIYSTLETLELWSHHAYEHFDQAWGIWDCCVIISLQRRFFLFCLALASSLVSFLGARTITARREALTSECFKLIHQRSSCQFLVSMKVISLSWYRILSTSSDFIIWQIVQKAGQPEASITLVNQYLTNLVFRSLFPIWWCGGGYEVPFYPLCNILRISPY